MAYDIDMLPLLDESRRITAEFPAKQPPFASAFTVTASRFAAEQEIVWLCDINLMPYVRAIPYSAPTRARAPSKRQLVGTDLYQIVGYSVLSSSVSRDSGGNFPRRFFALKIHDRVFAPNGIYSTGCPTEAVDPLTVKPGAEGEQNERAWRGLASLVA